jgi:hypothetical protein
MKPVNLSELHITAEDIARECEIVRCGLCGDELERVGVSKWQHVGPCKGGLALCVDSQVNHKEKP